ncbi:hypothetical protein DY000_02023853 [Brassica cretica]|uniref:Uncharacterized protein n=1 Tax=Brassica cretica TaxID=69181 RepID=A0ABQ7E1Y2_BRACR|nr:hypothetical protein DY000_02023853 [Brassica cretica]
MCASDWQSISFFLVNNVEQPMGTQTECGLCLLPQLHTNDKLNLFRNISRPVYMPMKQNQITRAIGNVKFSLPSFASMLFVSRLLCLVLSSECEPDFAFVPQPPRIPISQYNDLTLSVSKYPS